MRKLLAILLLLEALMLSPHGLSAQQVAISYAGLTEAFPLWMAGDGGFFKDNGIAA